MIISVVIALFNSVKYIENQLKSILFQTVAVDEVILVDDCSSDNTIEFVSDFIKKNNCNNWKLYSHESNKGYIRTFADAICYSSGDIIILCDHDDEWFSNKVELIRNAFCENDQILALATSFIQIDENGKKKPIRLKRDRSNNNLIRRKVIPESLNHMSLYDIAIYNISPGCTCAFSKRIKQDFISHIGVLPHDWLIYTIAACKNGLYYLDKKTTKYRIYSNNTIGLGHVCNYEKRKNNIKRALLEKQDMNNIIGDMLGINSDEFCFSNEVLKIFELRVQFFELRKFRLGIKLLYKSSKIRKLYESVILDMISVIIH